MKWLGPLEQQAACSSLEEVCCGKIFTTNAGLKTGESEGGEVGGRGGGGKEGAGLPGGAETESPLITGTCVDSPLSGRRLSLCPGLSGGGSDLASPTTGVAVCPP